MATWNDYREILFLEETASTNTYAKAWVRQENPAEGSVVLTDFQTGGRGQKGNTWFSTRGKNLLFSLIIYPRFVAAKEQFILSRIASLALKNTLDAYTDDVRIKWPNDIYWQDRKIAGILIENDLQDQGIQHSVIGIGLNVNQEVFPLDLPNPVSLRQITGVEHDKQAIFTAFIEEFERLYRETENGQITKIEDEYMLDLYRANGYHLYQDETGRFQARIENVLPSGHLVLRTLDNDEQRTYAFKEVQFVVKN